MGSYHQGGNLYCIRFLSGYIDSNFLQVKGNKPMPACYLGDCPIYSPS
jgi:hypothetical protein